MIALLLLASLFQPESYEDCWSSYNRCIVEAYARYQTDGDPDALIESFSGCYTDLRNCFTTVDRQINPWGIPMTGPTWREVRELWYE